MIQPGAVCAVVQAGEPDSSVFDRSNVRDKGGREMAGKTKDIWFIMFLLVVAGVFAFLAFSKGRPAAGPAPVQDSLAVKADPAAGTMGIKPDHTPEDMRDIVTATPGPAVIEPLHKVEPKTAFSVQVYSFKEKSRADAALKLLKEKNYQGYVMVSDLGERGIWYRVRVGTFSTEEEARRILESVIQDFKSGIIVTE